MFSSGISLHYICSYYFSLYLTATIAFLEIMTCVVYTVLFIFQFCHPAVLLIHNHELCDHQLLQLNATTHLLHS